MPQEPFFASKALSQLSPNQRLQVRINTAQPTKGISTINDLQAIGDGFATFLLLRSLSKEVMTEK
jgi:hypothetical protein